MNFDRLRKAVKSLNSLQAGQIVRNGDRIIQGRSDETAPSPSAEK
jgi:hypothetical protein